MASRPLNRLTTSGENVDFSHENFDAGITHAGEDTPDLKEWETGRLVAPFGLTPIKTGSYYFSTPDFNREADNVKAFQDWLVNTLNPIGQKEKTI